MEEIKRELVLPFKKEHEDAVLPVYAKVGDAGLDCFAVGEAKQTDDYITYDLGFSVQIPKGYVGLLFPRSSVSKKDLVLANCVGVIDSGYRGPVSARFKCIQHATTMFQSILKILSRFISQIPTDEGDLDFKIYEEGDAICQLVVIEQPYCRPQWVEELRDSERGTGGFGSTDAPKN